MPRPDPISYSGGLARRFFACLAVVAWHGIFCPFCCSGPARHFCISWNHHNKKQKKTECAAYKAKWAKKCQASPPKYDIGTGLVQSGFLQEIIQNKLDFRLILLYGISEKKRASNGSSITSIILPFPFRSNWSSQNWVEHTSEGPIWIRMLLG